jgi:hypothetical protein
MAREMLRLVLALMPALGLLAVSAKSLAQVDEREATERAYLDCLQRAAGQRDNQTSDAASIAHAILPACAGEYAAQKTAFGRFASDPATQRTLFETMDAAQLQTATGVVLKERLGRSSQ